MIFEVTVPDWDTPVPEANATSISADWNTSIIYSSLPNALGITGKGVIVAVLDSGINAGHADFKHRIVTGYNAIEGGAPPNDNNCHGSHVSSVVLQVAPDCRVMPVKVLNDDNVGTWAAVEDGISFAVNAGADIVNMSFGSSSIPESLQAIIREAFEHGVRFVAASGNIGGMAPFYPASLPEVDSVGAIDCKNEVWRLSTSHNTNIFAPGVHITGASSEGNKYLVKSGTSMAAPHVSGVLALLMQIGQADKLYQHVVDERLDCRLIGLDNHVFLPVLGQ